MEKPGSLDLDDDFALRTACFDVSQGLVGCLEWKDAINHGVNGPSLNESSDLVQLVPVGPHEEKRIPQTTTGRLFPDSGAQQADGDADEPRRSDSPCEWGIRRAGNRDE